MAQFPTEYPLWVIKRDNLDLVEGAHVNTLQDELDATQRALGRGITITNDQPRAWYSTDGPAPATAVTRFWSYDGTISDFKWDNLDARIDNIEKAALRDLDVNYVSRFGGALIEPTTNGIRNPASGGVAIVLPSTDPAPALAVLNTPGAWESGPITLWADGQIKARRLRLASGQSANVVTLDPDNGLQFGSVLMSYAGVTIGKTVLRVDNNIPSQALVDLRPPVNATGETMFLKNDSGGIRNVLRLTDNSGNTKFLLDTEGNITASTIKLTNQHDDTSQLDLDGVHLDKYGLIFTLLGGSYKPGGLVFNNGGGLTANQLSFINGQRIYASGNNIVVSGPLFQAEGGFIANGMKTFFYDIAGSLNIPIPQDPGGPQGVYEAPYKTQNKANGHRAPDCSFTGPATGTAEIHMSVAIRAYSRPVYVSYTIVDMVSGATVLAASDEHAAFNNGARSASEQSDVDQVSTSSLHMVGGLIPGRAYQLRIRTRAADTGPGDVGKTWTLASNCRILIKPLMTSYSVGTIHG